LVVLVKLSLLPSYWLERQAVESSPLQFLALA